MTFMKSKPMIQNLVILLSSSSSSSLVYHYMPYKVLIRSSVTPNMSHPLTHLAAVETHIYVTDIKGKCCCIGCILLVKSLDNIVLKCNYLFPLYILRKKLVKYYIWSMVLYGAETQTLRARDQKYLENFEMWCWRRMEKISWTNHVRNEDVLLRVNEQRNILHEIRKRKANWIGHILRRNCF